MAWEWVAPAATATSGAMGLFFTWLTGHQGRKHAESVAKQSASNTLAQAREARRAAAYLDILTTVNSMTTAVADITAIYKDQEDPPLPDMDVQIAASAKVGLYGSPDVRDTHRKWFDCVQTLLNNHRELQASRKSGSPREPELWKQQDEHRKAMITASKELAGLMNSELGS